MAGLREHDTYWEAYHRRSDPEGYWDGSSDDVPPDFDDNEDAWNDHRRRERLAEVDLRLLIGSTTIVP